MTEPPKSEWVSFGDIERSDDPLRLNDIPLDNDLEEPARPASLSPPPPIPPKPAAKIDVSSHEERKLDKKPSKNGIDQSKNSIDQSDSKEDGKERNKVFQNGKLITSIYPTNAHLAWVMPPVYDCAKVPKIMSDQQIKLPNDVYEKVMRSITDDVRFKSYSMLFSRILPLWILLSIGVLLLVLFCSPDGGFIVMVFTFLWMIMLFIGIFFCIIIRKYMVIALRHCVKDANRILMPYNLIAGVQDRGQLSCHKVVIIFVYFNMSGCQKDVERLIKIQNSTNTPTQISMSDTAVTFEAKELIFKHIQPYIKAYVKRRLLFPTRPSEGVSDYTPKHCTKSHCMCQFIESEHFNRPTRLWYERLV